VQVPGRDGEVRVVLGSDGLENIDGGSEGVTTGPVAHERRIVEVLRPDPDDHRCITGGSG
jgi:hypothetical protein